MKQKCAVIFMVMVAAACASACTASESIWNTPETVEAGTMLETRSVEKNKEKESVSIKIENENETTAEAESTPIELLFAGDVYLSNHVLNAYDKAGGISGILDETLRNQIWQADYFMVNEEFPFSERGQAAPDKQYTFRISPDRVTIFKEMGIDMVTLANNHALDYGRDALEDTFTTLEQAEIPYVGAGRNLEQAKAYQIIEIKGKKIGFLGASRVVPVGDWTASSTTSGLLLTYDPKLLLEQIQELKNLCDYTVVYVHWGVERETNPKDYQKTLGRQMIDAGADLVVGSHPHVLQPVEYYKEKPIVYSLGNFVFGSSIPKTELLKVTLNIDAQNNKNIQVTLIPAASSGGYTHVSE